MLNEHTINIMTDNADIDNLAEIVFVTFLHSKVTFKNFYTLYILAESHPQRTLLNSRDTQLTIMLLDDAIST